MILSKEKLRIYLIIICVGILIGKVNLAQASQPIILCPKVEAAPCVDGRLNDPCWTKASAVTDFRLYNNTISQVDILTKVQTTVYLCYDDKNLYLGYKLDEPKENNLKVSVIKRDGPVFWDDCVEFFLDTNKDESSYFHFFSNFSGIQSDSSKSSPTSAVNRSWNPEWKVATSKTKNEWYAEIAIPFKSLNVPAPTEGSAWGIGLARARYAGGTAEWSSFPVANMHHSPKLFASLTFGNNFSQSKLSMNWNILKKKLMAQGYSIKEKGDFLIAEKDGEKNFYPLSGWEKGMSVGREVDKLDYNMEDFPIGVFLYGSTHFFLRAKELGMKKWDYMAMVLDDIKAHNMNTVWFAGNNEEHHRKMADLCEKRNLQLVLQMNEAYFIRGLNQEKREKRYLEKILPFVSKVMPQYRSKKSIFAWSLIEETRAEYAEEVAAYRAKVMELDPTHPIVLLHNNLNAAKNMKKPYPSIMGFDRYFYQKAGDKMNSPTSAISSLEKDIPPFYNASLKYRIPFIFAMQGTCQYAKEIEPLQARYEIVRNSGLFINPKTKTYSYWSKYYPPRHCMSLQAWAAVAMGAKGIFCFAYGAPTLGKIDVSLERFAKKRKLTLYYLACDPSGKMTPQWDEFGETAKDIAYFAPLILKINKRVINIAKSDNPDIITTTFKEENSNRKYLIAVNKRTGFWSDNKLNVNKQGQLTGYTSAGSLEFVLKVKSNDNLYDLRTFKKLKSFSSVSYEKSYKITIPPGGGNIFLVGNTKDLGKCGEIYFNK